MKKEVYEINENGFIVDTHVAEFDDAGEPLETLADNIITVAPANGLYRAKWTGTAWVEDMSQTDIDAINNVPQPPTELELLRAENESLTQRATQNSADLQGFMDYYFSINPE